MTKVREIICSYQNLIDGPPAQPEQMYAQACSNDKVTINSWRPIWIANVKANHDRFGSFKEVGLGKLWGQFQNKPCIVVGSGPSLKQNAHVLLENKGIPVVSCLHNFHYLEDLGAHVDYYVTLDAGEITIKEVSEGGSKTEEEYWALTKSKKLIAFIGTSPRLLEKWQGEVYLFNCPVPDKDYEDAVKEVEVFNTMISNGGNVLGACLYIAKGIFGCNPIAFMGADFSFGYNHKFHAWDSSYDKTMGQCIQLTDIFGNRVLTWQSYANFKTWFDYIVSRVPGLWINASEGGCLGSYPHGNIRQLQYMDLSDFLKMYQMNEHLKEQCLAPEQGITKILF